MDCSRIASSVASWALDGLVGEGKIVRSSSVAERIAATPNNVRVVVRPPSFPGGSNWDVLIFQFEQSVVLHFDDGESAKAMASELKSAIRKHTGQRV